MGFTYSHTWLNLTISPRVIRSLKLYKAKASLPASSSSSPNRSRSHSGGNPIMSGVSIEVKRFTTSENLKPQPAIPFEIRKFTQVSAADVFCPPSSPLSPLSPCHQVQFEPLYNNNDHHQRPSLSHPFSQAH